MELEDRSRRNSIRIDGIKEEQYETWNRCEEKVQKLVKEKLDIEGEVAIDHFHIIKKTKKISQIMKEIRVQGQLFVDCSALKIRSSKKLKNTGIFICEDFCKDTMDIRKQLWVMGDGIGTSNQQQNFLFELSKHSS